MEWPQIGRRTGLAYILVLSLVVLALVYENERAVEAVILLSTAVVAFYFGQRSREPTREEPENNALD